MKNLLLLTDFSKPSENAAVYALKLFEGSYANNKVLHVQKSAYFVADDLMVSGTDQNLYEALFEASENHLTNWTKDLQNKFNNAKHHFENKIDFDGFVDAVEQTVQKNDIDLIVIGSNGASGWTEKLFGTHTLSLLKNLEFPLMVVTEKNIFSKLERILLVTEDDIDLDFDILKWPVFLAKEHQAHIHVLKLSETDDKERHDPLEVLENLGGITYHFHRLSGLPVELAISSFEQLFETQLTVVILDKNGKKYNDFIKKVNHVTELPDRSPTLFIPHK
ncbi:MAG: universal stress protein [Flavobacteriaceae bacterium]|nr:universal stress protein [Flavobacteriaceae bacterium]